MLHKKNQNQQPLKRWIKGLQHLALATVFFAFCFHTFAQNITATIPDSQGQIKLTFSPLVKLVRPSVVNVYAARLVQQRRSPFLRDPFFEQFFNRFDNRRPRINRSLGSGVIVQQDGIVVTNFHVIRQADEVKVALYDGRELDAEIIFTDEKSDLAILQLQSNEDFIALPLGDSESLEVGDLVLALGNPFGVGQTVTSGIVSALARSQGGVNDFGFFIQTDASINPGNSGGALVDMNGNLVGINTSIFTRSGGSNGIGFAVPSNMVRVALDSVAAGESFLVRPWLGAQFKEVTSSIAEAIGLEKPRGALVTLVLENSPANQAGLLVGDVILQLDIHVLSHANSLDYRLATAGIGRDVDLQVLRGENILHLSLPLQPPPELPPRDLRILQSQSFLQGTEIANLSPRLAIEEGFDSFAMGVVVLQTTANSLATRFGIRRGDIILAIDDIEMTSTLAVENYLQEVNNFSTIKINRNGQIIARNIR